jgi:hypothetical protein
MVDTINERLEAFAMPQLQAVKRRKEEMQAELIRADVHQWRFNTLL